MLDEVKKIQVIKVEKYDLSRVKQKFLVCGCSDGPGSQVATILGLFEDWGLALQCPASKCQRQWFTCCQCNLRQKIESKRQMYDHWRQKHKMSGVRKSPAFKASLLESEIDVKILEQEQQVVQTEPMDGVEVEQYEGEPFDQSQMDDDADVDDSFEITIDNSITDPVMMDEEAIPWETTVDNKLGFERFASSDFFQHSHEAGNRWGGLNIL